MPGLAPQLLSLFLAAYLPTPPDVPLPLPQRLAAERAAGLTIKGTDAYDDCGDRIAQIYFAPTDLNGDRIPELIVRAYSGCWGNGGDMFTILAKVPTGWKDIGSGNGTPEILKTAHRGWHDVEIGGPGFDRMPVLVWNGTRYDQ